MEISGNLPITNIVAPYAKDETASDAKTVESSTTSTSEPSVAISETENEISSETSQKAAGVIRKLQAGHFKGVADVRLRIKFNDQLQALQSEKSAQVVDTALPIIIDSQSSQISSFLETGGADNDITSKVTEASQQFSKNIEQIGTDYRSQPSGQTDGLISQLQSSFDSFISTLGEISDSQAKTETIVPDESVVASTELKTDSGPTMATMAESVATNEEAILETGSELLDFSQLIANLTDSFNNELDSLASSLANSSVLPEISEPTGNGAAFDKFMKIYSELNSLASQEKPPVNDSTSEPDVSTAPAAISEIDAIAGSEQISVLAR